LRVGFTNKHQYADPPHLIGLLRACRERPCRCPAAEQREKRAPFQSIELHPLPLVWPEGQFIGLASITSGACCNAGFPLG
jgi:hypothetical protein